MNKTNKAKSHIPKIKRRETKTRSRLFRFTERNYEQLDSLSDRYETNVSQVIDLLIDASRQQGFKKFLDKCVENMNSAG